MPRSRRLSALARSIDHTRLQMLGYHLQKDKAIALLQVGGPEQAAPGSINNETLWCCEVSRRDKDRANGGWEVADVQVVPSVAGYRAIETTFARENHRSRLYPPGSPKSRMAMVIGPSGSGLADVKITAAVFGQEAPVLQTQSDGDGFFLLPNSPPGEQRLDDGETTRRGYSLTFSKPGYLAWKENVFVTVDAEGNYDLKAFQMRATTVVSGKLLGVDGKSLEGKQVRLQTITSAPDQWSGQGELIQTTKPDGSFRFDNVYPGKHLVEFRQPVDEENAAATEEYTAAAVVHTSDYKDGHLTVDDLVLDLRKSSNTLAVTLLDQDGNPVPQVEIDVAWRPREGQWGGGKISRSLYEEHEPKVITNDEGQATLTGLPPGVWEIRTSQFGSDYWKSAVERLTFDEGDKLEATLQFPKPIDLDDLSIIDINSIYNR